VEIFQNCNVFNDGAFAAITSKANRASMLIDLHHGEPIRFGADGEQGVVRDDDGHLCVADVADVGEQAIVVHDETDLELAFGLSRLSAGPHEPTAVGVFRSVDRPDYGSLLHAQVAQAREQQGEGDLESLLRSGSTWEV
jgi:2-oxoglutarate ferredoxin oxidoreductase subunit beta